MKILNSRQKKEIEEMLRESYGCNGVFSGYVVMRTTEGELWIANQEIFETDFSKLRLKSIGLNFGKIEENKVILSVEGCQIVGKTAKKNIVELKDCWDFIRGFDLSVEKASDCEEESYVLLKYNEDFLGTGKLSGGVVKNALPKSRRIINLTKEKDL